MSASVKAYFALKIIGDSPAAGHMRRARELILARGGAANTNVFTRTLLALFGILPWRTVPIMPVEIMLLPTWFPFHLSKISYWARTVIVPLLILQALKPVARNPTKTQIDELFIQPPHRVRARPKAPHQKWLWYILFRAIDTVLRWVEPFLLRGGLLAGTLEVARVDAGDLDEWQQQHDHGRQEQAATPQSPNSA
jgi:squalene-hopene/tetraprenyl-beta-curcumene cyclase